MSETRATVNEMKRISVFNVIGFLFFFFAVLYVYVGASGKDEILFGGMHLTSDNFWPFFVLIILINTTIFIELWYYEENDQFHNHMLEQPPKLRWWDSGLRSLIIIVMVAWLIPSILERSYFFKSGNDLVKYAYHIMALSILLLFWSWLVNRGRHGEWYIIKEIRMQTKGQFGKYMFPYFAIIAFTLLLLWIRVIENPQEWSNYLSKIAFISSNGHITLDDLKTWIKFFGIALVVGFSLFIWILRWKEWKRVLLIGRSM